MADMDAEVLDELSGLIDAVLDAGGLVAPFRHAPLDRPPHATPFVPRAGDGHPAARRVVRGLARDMRGVAYAVVELPCEDVGSDADHEWVS